MVRRMMVLMFCLIVALVMCAVPQHSLAGSSSEQEKQGEKKEKKQKKEKKEKKEKQEKKDTGSNDKSKSNSDPVGGVNKMFDGFKKNQGGVKDDADKARKSTNDSWQKSK